MFLYYAAFFSIIFSNATGAANRNPYSYNQIVLSQRSIIADFYEKQYVWPTTNIDRRVAEITENAAEALLYPNSWILHGLFPQKRDGSSPQNCVPYAEGYVSSFIDANLQERLETHWPHFSLDKPFGSIWEEAWHTNGSCIIDINSLSTIDGYFDKALDLLDKYNIGNILEKYQIYPGDTVSVDNIYDIVNYEFSDCSLKCGTFRNSEREIVQYLLEITMCFDKKLKIKKCYNAYHACNNQIPVLYPTIQEV